MPQSSSVLLNRLLSRGKFRHMQLLVSLVELGSVQRAADAVGMTQSSVTQSLAYIEQLLEMPLFHRHAKGVRPNAACLDLLPMARQILGGLASGAEAMASRHNDGMGTVRLFASAAATHGVLLPHLLDFSDRQPEIHVQLQEAEREQLLLAVTSAQADLAVCRRPPVVPVGWSFEPLMRDHFVVVCGAQHPLARRRRVSWDELARASWLLSPAGSAARDRFEELAQAFAHPPATYPVVTRSLATMTWLLQSRSHLGFLPHAFVKHLIDRQLLHSVPLDKDIPMAPLGLLMPEHDLSPAASTLIDHLRACHPGGA